MSGKTSDQQLAVSPDGSIVAQPLTWDGEPLYSPETVAEGLFDPSAFEQMRGQLALEDGDDGQ